MNTRSLNGQWTLTYGPQSSDAISSAESPGKDWPSIPAKVPGNVELDMVAAGKLQDPSVGNNIYALRELETYQWWYQRSFPSPELDAGQRCELVFEGLDCLGMIWLNGTMIGATDNMLIPHRFDITDLLKRGGNNDLVVRINSAVLEGRKHHHAAIEYCTPGKWESLSIRKAPHMYGWDIMPRAVSAGLWRDVNLEIVEPTRFRDVHWSTTAADPDQRTARVMVAWEFVTDRPNIDDMRVRVTLERGGRKACQIEYPVLGICDQRRFNVENADLWWPRGYGDPALYQATVELIDAGGNVFDAHKSRMGLRKAELHSTPITTRENPGEFVFVVNGRKVFVKGTNWVPLDAFHSRDPQHLKSAIDMLADLNCNMARCWGGNVYEDHAFFDLCDENGIMVWQDFALACALYPQTDEFLSKIQREAEVIIKKLRNHCSLVLWSGNNENDAATTWTGLGNIDPNSDLVSRKILAEKVRQYDPTRPYLPSSPYYSPEVFRRGSKESEMPELHLWGPRGYYKADFYLNTTAHFVSEIGYHGCPNRQSLEEMLDAEYVWPWKDNDQWQTKSVRFLRNDSSTAYRIDLMARQMTYLFGAIPDNLDDFVFASQVTQAEAKKFFIEWWRTGKWHRAGILWWNLRDGWPIISDAIVDYYNRKKLAYEYIKRVQTDVCAICGEASDGQHPLIVVNDTLQPASGRVSVRNADDNTIRMEADFEVAANDKATAGHLAQVENAEMWLINWELANGEALQNHYMAGKLPIPLDKYRRWFRTLGIEPKPV